MEEETADAFVNRDQPIPVLSFPQDTHSDSGASDQPPKGKRERLKDSIKEKAQDVVSSKAQKEPVHGLSLQDRLLSKLLQQVLPEDEVEELNLPPDLRSSKYINRPSFSLPLMTSNFRRFNARIGIVFVFQNRLERLLTWRTPSHTISLLACCTFVCLDPYLLSVVPIIAALFFIMVPAYLIRHPPPPESNNVSYKLGGPPLAPARTIKPAGEMSKDFFRNMRDLQNSMDDFSNIHDAFVRLIAPATNFSNEALSSTIFLFLFLSACLLFLFAQLIPWRFAALLTAWASITLGHPRVRSAILANRDKHITPHHKHAQSWLDTWVSHDVVLDSPPEQRQVEIFELQHHSRSDEWEAWLFTSTPFDPLSPQRISGDRPKGTRFFEDVQPPRGWEWSDKKWVLDLNSAEWVEDRMVQGVEVEIESERWVSDLLPDENADPSSKRRDNDKEKKTKIGEWRRRRWIRMVQRRSMPTPPAQVSAAVKPAAVTSAAKA